jgi:small subunit ribosomal protein S6
MEKVKASYETLFVCDVAQGEEATKALVEKFTALIQENAENVEVNEWGKRRLAYPINDLNEGYYVLVTFNANASFPAELERVYSITEGLLRYMVVRTNA